MAKKSTPQSFINKDGAATAHKGKEVNSDGWMNLLASMGNKKDRRTNASFGAGQLLSYTDLTHIYRYNGLGRKIIDLPAYEMTREWIEIENDPENIGLNELKRLNAKQAFRDFVKWGKLFGGAIIVMGIDDGNGLEAPVNTKGIRRVNWLRVYDRHQVTWTTADINNSPESKYFGEPEFYTVSAYSSGNIFRVHRSRILMHYGTDVPERERVTNNGWGDSVLQSVYDDLRDYGITKSSAVNVMQDFIQTLLQIDNLAEYIAADKENIIKKRLDIIDLSRSVNNTILLDKGEDFSKQASTVTGIDTLIREFAVSVAAVTGIPFTKLFGVSPGGLNATGESDIRNFYDSIKSAQEDEMLPCLEKLMEYIMLSRDSGYKGAINEDAKICFVPLWQLSDKEDAEYKYRIAQTDEIYVRNAVLSPEEIAINRFGEGGFNPDTVIENGNRNVTVTPDEQEQ